MIQMKIRGASSIEGVMSQIETEYPLDRGCIWIGRGEEIN
jgi:hypothetical protein